MDEMPRKEDLLSRARESPLTSSDTLWPENWLLVDSSHEKSVCGEGSKHSKGSLVPSFNPVWRSSKFVWIKATSCSRDNEDRMSKGVLGNKAPNILLDFSRAEETVANDLSPD
jgi:hypothetical protein